MPVLIGVLWHDREAAKSCRTGDIELAFCPDCGFIWNIAFDPGRIEYGQRYDNSLHFSPTFQRYTQTVIERLIDTYNLHGKHLVDIGGGKGDFLAMMCETGGNFGYGFDPSYEGERVKTPSADRIQWSTEYYDERQARIQADLISSRFVFEHIPEPRAFLDMIRRNIRERERTVIYFEVPHVDLIVRQLSIWDIIYEHCSYFGVESLTRCFAECRFEVLHVAETYRKQYISIEARVATNGAERRGSSWGDVDRLAADVSVFRRSTADKIAKWRARLNDWRSNGVHVVAWGAGAKAVGFLNIMKVQDEIRHVVDINPRKRGLHLAGTGQRVIAPKDLHVNPPEVVILMNPIYRDEIESQLAAMGLAPHYFEL